MGGRSFEGEVQTDEDCLRFEVSANAHRYDIQVLPTPCLIQLVAFSSELYPLSSHHTIVLPLALSCIKHIDSFFSYPCQKLNHLNPLVRSSTASPPYATLASLKQQPACHRQVSTYSLSERILRSSAHGVLCALPDALDLLKRSSATSDN